MTERPRTPLPAPDRAAATALWDDYRAANPDATMASGDLAVEHFGDSVELADELLALVTHGPKRATAGLVAEFAAAGEPLPRVGSYWAACDGSGVPRVLLRSVELRIGVADSVDDAFAWDEGEGDRTRADWLAMHRRYWRRTAAARGQEWSEDSEVVFERFRVVWPPELAD
jgi:uncharacterized protein YhfF